MDRELFVQNIERYCALAGVKPTNACKESGVGSSFISDIKRGQTPSVAKVQQLAQYLGCTVSDLLGESGGAAAQVMDERYAPFLDLFAELDPAEQNQIVGDMLRRKNKK